MFSNLGYTKRLFILPFDHRSSFEKGMFGIKNRKPTPKETQQIIDLKEIIYEAFKKSISDSIKKDEAAILVDEQYGDKILRDAKQQGFITLLTTEKSGQQEFDFEYGSEFAKHIEKYKPTFAKALIRYNPEDEKQSKIRQQKNLKLLSDYCHKHGYKFLLEVLISQRSNTSDGGRLILSEVEGEAMTPPRWNHYDKETRPKLQVLTIKELQDAGVEPDIWKLEGMDEASDYERVVEQARLGGRKNVGVVVLGRGEDQDIVEGWIRVGAKVDGIIGFAVGRTVFWQSLIDFKHGKITRGRVVEVISDNFLHFYHIFIKARNS